MKHVVAHFKKVDPILASLRVDVEPIVPGNNYFAALCESIVSQQLSVKAGDTIWKRFVTLAVTVTPKNVLKLPDKKIRAAGISWSKISYLKNLGRHAKQFDLQQLSDMKNEDVIRELTKVKGIGPWTAEMFLMFTLGREDIFSYGDLGLRNAIKKLYKFKKDPTRKQMEKIVIKWAPYRTYAARILWKSLDMVNQT